MYHYIGHIRVYLEKIIQSAFLLSSRHSNKRPFLASEHRGRDPTWFSVRCWEKMQDLTLAPMMSG